MRLHAAVRHIDSLKVWVGLLTVVLSLVRAGDAFLANVGFVWLDWALGSENQRVDTGSLSRAAYWLERSVASASHPQSGFRGLALAYELMGNPDKAAEVWYAGGYEPGELLAWGDNYRRQRLWESAWQWYERAERLSGLTGPAEQYNTVKTSWTQIVNPNLDVDSGCDFGVGDRIPGNGIPDGWVVFSHRGGHDLGWIETSLEPVSHSGWALSLVPRRPGLDFVVASNPIVVDAGAYFTADCQAIRLAEGVRARMEVQFWDAAGRNLGFEVSEELEAANKWENLEVQGGIPQGVVWLTVRLRVFEVEETGIPLQFRAIHLEMYLDEPG